MNQKQKSRHYIQCACNVCGEGAIWVEECRRSDQSLIAPIYCPRCDGVDTIEELKTEGNEVPNIVIMEKLVTMASQSLVRLGQHKTRMLAEITAIEGTLVTATALLAEIKEAYKSFARGQK